MRRTTYGATLEAIEQVYRQRHRDFLRIAQAVVGDAETAKDVVHEAFVSAVRRRESYRGSGALEAWICRMLVNEAQDQARRRTVVPLDERITTSAGIATGPDRRWVRSAVAALPEQQRLVLFLHYFGDLDYATVADTLGIQPGTVAATLNAARRTLARRLSPDLDEEAEDESHRQSL
jgi:RNA polymerase sigma-70 factor (ECF subfamily)